MSEPNTRLEKILISKIRENPVALRAVNRTSDDYLSLVDSIKLKGVLNPITVREVKDADNGEMVYGLIDGLHRFTGAQDAGLEQIPAHVLSMTDAEVLEAQLIANVNKIETKPAEYSKQLVRILAANPLLLLSELSSRLARSPKWLQDRLSLTKLTESIQKLVDENKINLSNAYALAKLEQEDQVNFLDRAMTMTPQEFVPTVNARAKEVRDAKRQGRDSKPDEFIPVPFLQKIGDMKTEMENLTIGPVLIKKMGVSTPSEAFRLGLKWALHMDPESIEVSKQKWEAKKKEREAENLRKKEEKLQKKQEDAVKKQQEAREELEKLHAGA